MLKLVLTKWSLKRLEPYDGKLSRTVLRGWKGWQRLFYYPTLNLLKISHWRCRFKVFSPHVHVSTLRVKTLSLLALTNFEQIWGTGGRLKISHWRCRLKIFNAHVALTTLRLKILSLLVLINFEQIWSRVRRLKISHWLVCGMLVLMLANPVVAEVKTEDQEWARGILKNAQNLTMEGIEHKYLELQKMLGLSGAEIDIDPFLKQELPFSKPSLRIFVSSSMSTELLKAYVQEAKDFGAVLVFKGLPGGSWQELMRLVSRVAGDVEESAIQIDDEAFERFEISSVPAFVLSKDAREFWQENKKEVFDKVTGNIGIRAALEVMAKDGDLANEASNMLEKR